VRYTNSPKHLITTFNQNGVHILLLSNVSGVNARFPEYFYSRWWANELNWEQSSV